LLLLCGDIDRSDPICGCDLSLILRANHEEDKIPRLRDDLPALLSRDQGNNTRWDYLRYPCNIPDIKSMRNKNKMLVMEE